ncbi:homoserine O-succinyltransferase [[Clostridium] innocuum]|nr:homoserine O-succinyltransferase [Erysipelotrichaceae bacterium]MCR0384929.1 homoserine O-succinyltransferase [[Clostridium] innocuum]MCR0413147.1 homoserine O-succinyltransferase [[Clostridium] innocuum]MCR0533222.1 homoserine O-succinyltransferase [[Clostridium] innocuum]MCR0537288.1 homoserine O-succinyltransferase [[Clostridium] innocuum]
MPINIPNGLPAKQILESEKIFALEEDVARKQDIRPLKIVILNLMPKKIETETQILRLISKSPLQVDIDFMMASNHVSKNTSADHLLKFYDDFSTLKKNRYDCLIITGAPVEHLEFEDVDYWEELCEIMEWSKTHVYSTLHICWGAQAGLYYHYHIQKHLMKQKVFGIYPQMLCDEYNFLTNGFDEIHYTPHSRHTAIDEEALAKQDTLEILSRSDITGSNIVATRDFREIYILGHLEYGKETLAQEYFRDLSQGKEIQLPFNYFPEDDPQQEPVLTWRSHANLLYRNWLNYVYQMTPYDLQELSAYK